MSVDTLETVSDGALRGAVARLVTRRMAREPIFQALIRSVDDMNDVFALTVGEIPLTSIVSDATREAAALRAVCADMLRQNELGAMLGPLLARGGDTLIDPPTESVLHAAVLLILWPHLEAGYRDLDHRQGLWVSVKAPGVPLDLLRDFELAS